MVWIRISITMPKATATPAQRLAAHALADSIIAAQPAGALVDSRFFPIADPAGRWQTFGVSVTVWSTQAAAAKAHADLNKSHGKKVFTDAIEHVRTIPIHQR